MASRAGDCITGTVYQISVELLTARQFPQFPRLEQIGLAHRSPAMSLVFGGLQRDHITHIQQSDREVPDEPSSIRIGKKVIVLSDGPNLFSRII